MTYRLALDVDFEKFDFKGELRVSGVSATPELRLNSCDLQIETVEAGGRSVPFRHERKTEEVVVGPLPPGTSEVVLRYRGKVSTDSLAGFYRSRNGPGAYFLTTHLAPTGARRVFPCVDHPATKAVFDVEVTADASLEVLFNTDPRTVEVHGGRKTWKFHPTPKMSTYLLYLGVGKFDTLEETREGLRVAVKGPVGTKSSFGWGLENGHRSVQAYAGYYGIPYPLPKLDLISVDDFAAGAMENWGAITFRESALLADRTTSTYYRQVIAEVVAHEIAHQWFGNLVTMAWWNDIWLNESFATFMSYKMVDRFYPDWDILGQLLGGQTGPALFGDSLENTHPVDVEVKNVEEINQIFDDISYGKGASVLRMLEAYVGEEAFRAGVAAYLRAHAYGNAKGDDLWSALETSSRTPIRRIVDPWIHVPGHPVVEAERHGSRLHLRQRSFRLDGSRPEGTWPIPLTYRAAGKAGRVLFETPELDLELPEADDLSLNVEGVGFYRVRYDPSTYDRLLRHFPRLPARERWSLFRDLYGFLIAGEVGPDLYRRCLQELCSEGNWMVNLETDDQVSSLYTIFGGRGPLSSESRAVIAAQSDRMGLIKRPNEPASLGIARQGITLTRAYLEPEFAKELGSRFRNWGETDPDLRRAVAVGFARSEGSAAFGPIVERAKAAKSESETMDLICGLVAFHDAGLVAQALDWAVSGGVSRGLLSSVGARAAQNPDARTAAWTWFRDHLGDFEKVYNGTAMLTLMVERVVPFAGLGRQNEVRRALTARPIAEAERGVRKGLELLQVYERLLERLA